MFRLPPYAHELNPVEPVWAHLKRPLANRTKHNITELTAQVKMRLNRMQYRPGLLVGLLASTGLHVGALPVIPPSMVSQQAKGTFPAPRTAPRTCAMKGPGQPSLEFVPPRGPVCDCRIQHRSSLGGQA